MKARLREELKSANARKTARSDVESDLVLLRELLVQSRELASVTGLAAERRILSSDAAH
jgi:hypothetical protein